MAAEVLVPSAETVDQAPVLPEGHLRALAEAGLFDDPGFEVAEVLAGACGVTYFVWAQHHSPLRLLSASLNAALAGRWLPPMRSGEVLAGIAFAHLRREPCPVVAEPVGGGYVVRGEAPWVTSWGLAGVFAVGARCGSDVVWLAVEPSVAGLRPSPPLRLAVMNASSTVRLGFPHVFLPDACVMGVQPHSDWLAQDRVHTTRPNPAAFGVAATCVRLLGEPRLGDELADCRAQSLAADPEDHHRRVGLRAWSLELAVRCAYAVVVAGGGRVMQLSEPPQRLFREACFYAIQGQDDRLRQATLSRLIR